MDVDGYNNICTSSYPDINRGCISTGETCINLLEFEDDAEAHGNECSLFYTNINHDYIHTNVCISILGVHMDVDGHNNMCTSSYPDINRCCMSTGETCIYLLEFEDDFEAHSNECSLFYTNINHDYIHTNVYICI
jgi:hypothetical protein